MLARRDKLLCAASGRERGGHRPSPWQLRREGQLCVRPALRSPPGHAPCTGTPTPGVSAGAGSRQRGNLTGQLAAGRRPGRVPVPASAASWHRPSWSSVSSAATSGCPRRFPGAAIPHDPRLCLGAAHMDPLSALEAARKPISGPFPASRDTRVLGPGPLPGLCVRGDPSDGSPTCLRPSWWEGPCGYIGPIWRSRHCLPPPSPTASILCPFGLRGRLFPGSGGWGACISEMPVPALTVKGSRLPRVLVGLQNLSPGAAARGSRFCSGYLCEVWAGHGVAACLHPVLCVVTAGGPGAP